MRKITTLSFSLLAVVIAFNCSSKKPISFLPVGEGGLNYTADSSFRMPKGPGWDERKRLHDSCMGGAFGANVMLMLNRDTITLGTVINSKTMHKVLQLNWRSLAKYHYIPVQFVTKPCYERMPVDIPIPVFFHRDIVLDIKGADAAINNEVNTLVKDNASNGIEIGQWLTAGLDTRFGAILDTAKDTALIAYKTVLLEPDNVVMMKSSSITNITFYLSAQKGLSPQLRKLLLQKPLADVKNEYFKAQLFMIDEDTLQVTFSGIFQILGQFVKCSQE